MKTNTTKRTSVTLITTERNEAENISAFLDSIDNQSLQPDEIVIADAASTDGTVGIIQGYIDRGVPIKLVSAPGNRSVGRNAAVKAASHEIIACTDVGCRHDRDWLMKITEPLRSDPTLGAVAGLFKADPQTRFEEVSSALVLRDNDDIDLSSWLPSSRSIAFTKTAWQKAGGYPEYEEFGDDKLAKMCGGEDTLFDISLKEAGYAFADGLSAVAYWRPRPNTVEFYKQQRMYSIGDGIRTVDPLTYLKLATVYPIWILGSLILLEVGQPFWALVLTLLQLLRIVRKINPARQKLQDNTLLPQLIWLTIVQEVGQMVGYSTGYLAQWRLKLSRPLHG